jgi:hypothetical protein
MSSPPPEFAERFGGTTRPSRRSSSQMRASRSSDSKEVIFDA